MANILDYNKALTQYNQGNYSAAQKTVAPFGQSVVNQFAAPQSSSGNRTTSAPQQSSGGGGNSNPAPAQPDYNKMIDDAYNGALSAFDQAGKALQSGYDTGVTDITSRVQNELNKNTTNGQQLTQSTQEEQDAYNKQMRSAYDQAVNAYNVLQQKARTLYGANNPAFAGLLGQATKEFNRQQGIVQDQTAVGGQKFADEYHKINLYVQQNADDLNQYKNEALDQLKNNLQTQLANIASQKGQTEIAKANARIGILQQAQGQAQAINAADTQFRQQLAANAVSQLQQIAGRVFTPQEIQAQLSNYMNALSGQNVGSSGGGQPQQQAVAPGYHYDEFGNLVYS